MIAVYAMPEECTARNGLVMRKSGKILTHVQARPFYKQVRQDSRTETIDAVSSGSADAGSAQWWWWLWRWPA